MSSAPISDPPQTWPRRSAAVVGDGGWTARLATHLLGAGGFAVTVTTALPGEEAAAAAGVQDLLVLALGAPPATRIEALDALCHGVPLLATLPAAAGGRLLRRALQCGADGIVFDEELATALVPSAHALLAGQLAVPRGIRRQIAPQALSHREKEILALVVRGLTNAQIAATLFVAESTVKTHLSSAFGKLDAGSRAEAAALVLDPDAGPGLALPPSL